MDGSGFQTAILAKLSAKVFTVERVDKLMERPKGWNIKFCEYLAIKAGTEAGMGRICSYDRIMVTAAPSVLPDRWSTWRPAAGWLFKWPTEFAGTSLITKTDDGDVHMRP